VAKGDPSKEDRTLGREKASLGEDRQGEGITLPSNPAKSEISPPKRFQKHPAPLQATNRIASSQDCSKVRENKTNTLKELTNKTVTN
jgi:hypothetical protein